MKTIVLIRNAETADFTDRDICSVVALAGKSTLLVSQRSGYLGEQTSSPGVVRMDLRTLGVKTPDTDALRSWRALQENQSSIWVFDSRNLQPHKVGLALASLRSQIFYLQTPPPAIVLETESDAHIQVFETFRTEFALDIKLEKSLKRGARQIWLHALLMHFFGSLGFGITKRISKALAQLG